MQMRSAYVFGFPGLVASLARLLVPKNFTEPSDSPDDRADVDHAIGRSFRSVVARVI